MFHCVEELAWTCGSRRNVTFHIAGIESCRASAFCTLVHPKLKCNFLRLIPSQELSTVKVKHKGQVALPPEFRERLGLKEGALLSVKEHPEGILLRPIPPPEAGEVVGEDEYQRMLEELELVRRCWKGPRYATRAFS